MNTIKRDVYVLRNTIKIPIEVTKGTDMVGIEFTVRDFNIPVTAAAVAYSYNKKMKKPNSQLCDVSDNVISFAPGREFFEVGMNELQIRVINEDKVLISFKEKVKCSDAMGFPDDEEEKQQTLIEQLVSNSGKETGERKKADETERNERTAAIEKEKSERTQADATEKSERKAEIDVERKRIDNLAKLPAGSTTGDAELKDIRVGADGTIHGTAGEAVRQQVGSLKEDINNITEEITIPGWCKIGYYSGEEHNTTHGVSLFFEIPKHVKQIRVVANGRAYFNDYTFINEDDNIVSYGAKLTQDKDIDVLIDVPSGATKVVVGGKIEDCDSASVFYKATVKKETEAYIKRLIGKRSKIFFAVGVRSEGSVDNSIYYDVANAISITVNGTFEQRKDIATFIDNNGVLVGSVSATVTGSTKKTISVPKKAKTVYISTTYQNLNSAVVFGKYEIEQSNLKGKKIVWLGTSIPAGGKNGIEVADSYPVYIGKMLDATVYNEAV